MLIIVTPLTTDPRSFLSVPEIWRHKKAQLKFCLDSHRSQIFVYLCFNCLPTPTEQQLLSEADKRETITVAVLLQPELSHRSKRDILGTHKERRSGYLFRKTYFTMLWTVLSIVAETLLGNYLNYYRSH